MLVWTELKRFPGEYECRVGYLEFSVSDRGHWDISAVLQCSPRRVVTIQNGQCVTLSQAKRCCQKWFDKQLRAMQKLPLFSSMAFSESR